MVKAVIGITSSRDYNAGKIDLPKAYTDAIRDAGGVPWIIPNFTAGSLDSEMIDEYFERLDGLLLSGGPDLAPVHFGAEPHPKLAGVSPERDEIELGLARQALQMNLPILAICRGIQVMNVAGGGTLFQDIAAQVKGALQHRQQAPRWYAAHSVVVEGECQLRNVLNLDGETLMVNTYHHQSVCEPAPGFTITARAPDGVIEAIENPDHPFALGVQWHPEGMYEHHPVMLGLFEGLVRAADEFAAGRNS